MKTMNNGSVIEKLREIFARFGLPNKIVSDNGPQFRSEEFIQFCKNNMIRFVTSPSYHPATNGSAENAVKSLKNGILKEVKDKINNIFL
jgi:transposase InsO family protein